MSVRLAKLADADKIKQLVRTVNNLHGMDFVESQFPYWVDNSQYYRLSMKMDMADW